MSLRINYNDAAANAHRNLQSTSNKMSQSIERLSSGYRINRASDDPAGLVNSEKYRAQISGLVQAVSNSQDAVNLVKTAEGALTEVHSLLRSMRDLSVHAANTGANDSASIAADQSQIASAIESLNRISTNTAFGSKKLLDGTGTTSFTVNDKVNFVAMNAASNNSAFAGLSGAVDINNITAATQATLTGGHAAYGSAAATVNAGDVYINGTKIGTFTAASTVQNVIDTINAKQDTTGVTAGFSAGAIVLTSKDYGSDAKIVITESAAIFNAAAGTTADAGSDISITAAATGQVTVGGVDVSTVGWTGKGNVLSSAAGDTITVVAGKSGSFTNVADVSGGALLFQIGANAGETASVSIASSASDKIGTGADATYTSVALIDVTKDAKAAIKVLDAAISQVSKQRANLGAFQKNVLESNINSLGVAQENMSSTESAIRDADMAAEMVGFTRYQILNQAGTSMLTQANQAPQQLLSLLR